MRMEHQSLNRNWEAAKNLLSPENTDPASVESNFRTAMAGAGFSQADIDQQLEAYRAARGGTFDSSSEDEGPDQSETAAQIQQLATQQEHILRETNQARRHQLENLMGTSVSMAVDTNKDLNTLINRLAQLDSNTDPNVAKSSRKQVLADEIRSEAVKILRNQRSSAGGNWNDSWIPAATQQAADIIHKKYRTVIGDPSRIGRVTETDAGEFLASRPPVKPPEYRKGMSMEDAGKSVRDFAVDALLRGVASKENSI
jgi:hypothetical protein